MSDDPPPERPAPDKLELQEKSLNPTPPEPQRPAPDSVRQVEEDRAPDHGDG